MLVCTVTREITGERGSKYQREVIRPTKTVDIEKICLYIEIAFIGYEMDIFLYLSFYNL